MYLYCVMVPLSDDISKDNFVGLVYGYCFLVFCRFISGVPHSAYQHR